MREFARLTVTPTVRRRAYRLLALTLILLSLALTLQVGASAVTSTGDGGWLSQNSGTTTDLKAVAFSDATHGWAVGDQGTIVATTNGGATWSAQNSGTTADSEQYHLNGCPVSPGHFS